MISCIVCSVSAVIWMLKFSDANLSVCMDLKIKKNPFPSINQF